VVSSSRMALSLGVRPFIFFFMFWCLNVNGLLVLKNGSFVYPFVGKYEIGSALIQGCFN